MLSLYYQFYPYITNIIPILYYCHNYVKTIEQTGIHSLITIGGKVVCNSFLWPVDVTIYNFYMLLYMLWTS